MRYNSLDAEGGALTEFIHANYIPISEVEDAIEESYAQGLSAYQGKQFPDDPEKAIEESDEIDDQCLKYLKDKHIKNKQDES